VRYGSFFLFFSLRSATCSRYVPMLRPVSQDGPMHSLRDGTSVV